MANPFRPEITGPVFNWINYFNSIAPIDVNTTYTILETDLLQGITDEDGDQLAVTSLETDLDDNIAIGIYGDLRGEYQSIVARAVSGTPGNRTYEWSLGPVRSKDVFYQFGCYFVTDLPSNIPEEAEFTLVTNGLGLDTAGPGSIIDLA